ncbi:MAG: molybdopterin cofactor-binding domain-containing protein [Anaerolineae bacterium]
MVFRKLVGAEVKRKEDPRLITGRGTYTANLRLPGMKHVAFVRSPYAHARIGSIDAAAALSIPGVAAVISGEDLKSAYRMLPVDGGNPQHSRYALAVGRVRHVGEAALAVIADSPEIAFDAAAAVAIDWQPLPVVATLEQAMAADAPPIYEDMTHNILGTSHHLQGDVDAAFAQAQHVIKQRIVSQRLAAVPMEPRAVAAAPDPTNGGLTLWSSTQTPHGIRSELATQLGLTENLVRVIAPDVGGGFGVKIGLYPEELALAALALRLQMPLCWAEDRSENLLATTHGRAQITDLELAVQQDGKVSALRIDVTGDVGAYPIFTFLPWLTGRMSVGVYHIPAVEINTRCICTNTTPVAAYRGAGRPEAAYYIERLMDIAALELGIDPVEIRRKNLIPPDAFPTRRPPGLPMTAGSTNAP